MPTVESAEKQALIQMLREEVVLEYTGHGYSEHRDLNAEETAQGILDSEWLKNHDAAIAKAARKKAKAEAWEAAHPRPGVGGRVGDTDYG